MNCLICVPKINSYLEFLDKSKTDRMKLAA